jgi:ceramide glucosyltransferase
LATNGQFLPSAVTGVTLGLAHPCFGQTIAMRRETLERIGGFAPPFASLLAEDHAIGEAVRRTGGRVAIPPFTISHACAETTFSKFAAHELRWSRTIRAIDPAGHLGSLLIHPFALALVGILFSGGAAWSWPLAAAALLVRLALNLRTDRVLARSHDDLWLLPLSDALAFALFVASFCSSRVTWRGSDFSVDGNGRLSSLSAK